MASAATAAPVRGSDPPPPPDAAMTVRLLVSSCGEPLVPEPVATIVCAPASVPSGLVAVAGTLPLAAEVTVSSTTGSECNVIVTLLDGFHPVDSILTEPPACTDVGEIVRAPSPPY